MKAIQMILFIISLFKESYSFVPLRFNNSTRKMKEFDINLDLPIKARYKEVFEYYGRFIDYLVFSERQTSVIRNLLYLASQGQDSDFQEHMEAFAELSGLSIFDIIALNYSYELTACTTILLRDSNNNILMGRNLDYFTYYAMVNMLFKANYYQNNTLLFQAITLPGMLGSINSIKKGIIILLNLAPIEHSETAIALI